VRKFHIPWTSVSLTAATAKTIIELPSPANIELELAELFVGFDYASTTPGACVIEFGTFTTTGTGTAATPQKYTSPGGPIDSAVSAAKVADTVEPTSFTQGTLGGTCYPAITVPLPGYFQVQWPLEEGLCVPESANFAVRLTSTVACATRGWLAWKE
jgi:hypothetical protein